MKNLKLSPLEKKIVNYLMCAPNGLSVSQLADSVFTPMKKDLRPINPNNSVVSAIRQINKKRKGTIKGINRGRNGKLVNISQAALKYIEGL